MAVLTARDGTSELLTVTEAMWKGRPVIASRIGGIQDQIVDGEHGWRAAGGPPVSFDVLEQVLRVKV